ncbi:uncharacterized protein [Oscarella lobularis]|uniref:uncharacterized protein n=1 Tax=Oscarella lobularis TaxID=121494 RepID=UPI0033143B30
MLRKMLASLRLLLLFLLLKASFVATTADCDTVAANCIQNPSCNATFTAYLTACDRVLNTGLPADCTADCRTKLNASNEMEPAFVTCNVTTPQSQKFQANILKGCFGIAPPTSKAPTGFLCSAIGTSCSIDPNCGPVVGKYLADCGGVFTGQPCTSACSSSTAALFEIWPAFGECSCGTDQTCITAEPHVRNCLGNTTAAPSPNFCSVLGLKCGYDDECRPILENYLNSCAFLFTGSPHGCTAQCHSTVTAFQEYRPDSRNCVCGADSSCTVNEPRVQLCIDDGPVAPQACSAVVENGCGSNSTCKSIVETYIDSCAKVFESDDEDCTAECKGNLERAVAALPSLGTCVCSGNRTCTRAQINIQKACYDLIPASGLSCSFVGDVCSRDSACNSKLTKYLASCASVLKSGEASDCSQACRDDLNNLVLASPAHDTCFCSTDDDDDDDDDCTTTQANIQKGCFPEASSKADKVATAVSTLTLVVLAFNFI